MSSSSAAATETPKAKAKRLYEFYVETYPEPFGGPAQAPESLIPIIKKATSLSEELKTIIEKNISSDYTLSFVEEKIPEKDRNTVYNAIIDATLVPLGGGRRKSRKSSKSRRRKSKTSKRKSRKN